MDSSSNNIPLYKQLDWWNRQWRGKFNLELYLKFCRAKEYESSK